MYEPVVRASAGLRLLRAAVFAAACVALSAAGHTLAGGATGTGVPAWSLGVAVLLVLVVAVPPAGRERTLPGIAAGLALGQLALHGLYTFAQGLTAARTGSGGGGRPDEVVALARELLCNGHLSAGLSQGEARRLLDDAGLGHLAREAAGHGTQHLDGSAAAGGLPPLDALAFGVRHAVTGTVGSVSLSMLLGHLLAALATGWLLHRGEVALWRLIRASAFAADELGLRALRTALRLGRPARGGYEPPRRLPVPSGGGRALRPGSAALRHSVIRRGPPGPADDFALTA